MRPQHFDTKTATPVCAKPTIEFPAIPRRVRDAIRFFDIMVGAAGSAVALYKLYQYAPMIRRETGLSAIFRQERGLRDNTFLILKLRTYDYRGEVPKACEALRENRDDEWLQFFLVLRGTMSAVGPRPLIPGESEPIQVAWEAMYPGTICPAFLLKPGVTGKNQTEHETQEEQHDFAASDALELMIAFSRLRTAIPEYWKTVLRTKKMVCAGLVTDKNRTRVVQETYPIAVE